MTRLLHTGDTHLGYRQYHLPARREDFLAAFRQVAEDAVAADVDGVVHAGDLFHDRQPALGDVMGAVSVLRVLEAASIPFFGVVGNHESKRDRQWLDLFAEMGLATRLGSDPIAVGDVVLYGLDFVPRSQREALDYKFAPPPSDADHTALVSHGLFEPFEHGDWDARNILSESPVTFDAILLGDDHTPRQKQLDEFGTWLTYCGSTERASASEREARGYNLVTFDDGVDIRRRSIDTREFVFVDVDLSEGEGTGRVRKRLSEYELEGSVVIATVTGDGERITPADVETYATERGALVARVNDRREREEESTVEVSFADPDRAVEQRIQELGLSGAAHELDEVIRASSVADSNVADAVEDRVAELATTEDHDVFDPVEPTEVEDDETTTDPVDADVETKTAPPDGETDDGGPDVETKTAPPDGETDDGGPDVETKTAPPDGEMDDGGPDGETDDGATDAGVDGDDEAGNTEADAEAADEDTEGSTGSGDSQVTMGDFT